MPLYEYRCKSCSKKFELFAHIMAEPENKECPHCKGKDVERLISRVSFVRSEEDLMEDMMDPSKLGDMENPKEMQKWAKRMGEDMGEDFEESLEGMENGSGDEDFGDNGGMAPETADDSNGDDDLE